MSRKPPTHKAPPMRPAGVNLFALPSGGFLIRDPFYLGSYVGEEGSRFRMAEGVAFSTLDEALSWLRDHMARPVTDGNA
jgi:hypothetical protein